MQKIFVLYFVLFFSVLSAQTPGSLLQTDSTSAKKDTIVFIQPIQHIGSLFSYRDSSRTIFDKDIPWIEYRSLSDLLWYQSHIYIRDLSSVGQNNNIAFGGIDNRGIAVLFDGRSQADQYTNAQNVWLVPPDAIERLEIISGPRAFFYGENAASAAINVVTKNYYTNRPFTRLRYSQGVDNYTQTDALFSQNIFRGVNFTLALNHLGYGSNKSYNSYRGRFTNANDDAWNIRSKIRYNFNSDLNIVFSYHYNKTWTGLNGGVDLINTQSAYLYTQAANVYNNEAYEKISNSHYDVTIALHPFSDSSQTTTLSAYASTMLREYRDDENRTSFNLNGILTAHDYEADLYGVKFQHSFNSEFYRVLAFAKYEEKHLYALTKNELLTGGLKNDFSLLRFLDVSLYGTVTQKNNNNTLALGGDGTITVTNFFQIFGGASQSYIPVSPAAQLFQIPYSQPYARKDEHVVTLQTGIKIHFENTLSLFVSYLRQQIKNPLILDTLAITAANEQQYYFPTSHVYNGVSFSLKYSYKSFHLDGIANYLEQPSLVWNTKNQLLFPKLYLDGSLYYRGMLANNNLDLKAGIRGRFISEQDGMKPLDDFSVWIPYHIAVIGPSGALDIFAIGRIGDANVHLIWENVFNNQYMLTPFYPMNATNIRFGVTWDFFD